MKLSATYLLIIAGVQSCLAGVYFEMDFENPPHQDSILSDHSVTAPGDRPWEIGGPCYVTTNYPGMTGQAALFNGFESQAWLDMFFGSPVPPYAPVSTSGVNVISWKVAISAWTATSDNPPSGLTYQTYFHTESLVSGDPFITLRFEYFGGTAGVVRISDDGYISTFQQIATFTTGVTYNVCIAIDLDQDTYSVWFDGVQVIANKYKGPWQEIMHAGFGISFGTGAATVIYDDISWFAIGHPNIVGVDSTSITWSSESGSTYHVHSSTDMRLAQWSNIVSSILATGIFMTAVLPNTAETGAYFRTLISY